MLCWNILDLGIHLHADKIPITVERVIPHHHFFPIPSRTTCQHHMVKNCRNSLRNTRAKGVHLTFTNNHGRENSYPVRRDTTQEITTPIGQAKAFQFCKIKKSS